MTIMWHLHVFGSKESWMMDHWSDRCGFRMSWRRSRDYPWFMRSCLFGKSASGDKLLKQAVLASDVKAGQHNFFLMANVWLFDMSRRQSAQAGSWSLGRIPRRPNSSCLICWISSAIHQGFEAWAHRNYRSWKGCRHRWQNIEIAKNWCTGSMCFLVGSNKGTKDVHI